MKQIQREQVRTTKAGQINKQDLTKIPMIYLNEYVSAQRQWEFLAMADGIASKSALFVQAKMDFLYSIYKQSSVELV